MKFIYNVKKDNIYKTVKDVLIKKYSISKSLIIKLKENNKISINNKSVFINTILDFGDILEIDMDFEESSDNIVAKECLLDIIYEDDYYMVINKPYGIVTHPTTGYYDNTLSNFIKYYFDKNNIKSKVRPIARLDKNTSRINNFCKVWIYTRIYSFSNN